MSDICEEITHTMQELAAEDNGSLGLIVELLRACRTEIERLKQQVKVVMGRRDELLAAGHNHDREIAEAAAFLDELAKRLDDGLPTSHAQALEQFVRAAADCRAMAAKLRGKA